MVRRVFVPDIEDYLRCPLFYRYLHEFKLPYNVSEEHRLLTESAQRAVSAWFNALGKGLDRRKAREKVGRSLSAFWAKNGGGKEGFPLAHARIMSILISLDKHFDQEKDQPIGGDMDVAQAIDNTIFEDTIHGLYIKGGLDKKTEYRNRTMVVVQVLSNTKLSPHVMKMRKAMTRYAINSAFKPNPYPLRLLTVAIPECTVSWHDLDKAAYAEFIYLARSTVRHLDGGMYLPTIRRDECRTCPYQKICSNRFCEPKVSLGAIEKLRSTLRTKA